MHILSFTLNFFLIHLFSLMLKPLFVLANFCPPHFQLWSILEIKRDAFITSDEVLERTTQKHVARVRQISHSLSSVDGCLRTQSYILVVGKISSTDLTASGAFCINQLHSTSVVLKLCIARIATVATLVRSSSTNAFGWTEVTTIKVAEHSFRVVSSVV